MIFCRTKSREICFVCYWWAGPGPTKLSIAYVSPGWVLGRLSTKLSKREDRESPTASMVLTCWRLSLRNSSTKSFNSFHLKKSNDINNLSMSYRKKIIPHIISPITLLINFTFQTKVFPPS